MLSFVFSRLTDQLDKIEASYILKLLELESQTQQPSLRYIPTNSYLHQQPRKEQPNYDPLTLNTILRSEQQSEQVYQKKSNDNKRSELSNFNVGFLNKVTADGAKSTKDRNMLKQFYGGSVGPG